MPVVRRTITIDAPLPLTFEISNRLESWPEMMEDYQSVEILSREGRKVWFRLTQVDGSSWVSWRVIHPEGGFALAERHEPRAPFKFMQHVWTYRELEPRKTEMSWEMNFELPEEQQSNDARASAYMMEHAGLNQAKMKAYIEAQQHADAPEG